jgi:hypothetical protein
VEEDIEGIAVQRRSALKLVVKGEDGVGDGYGQRQWLRQQGMTALSDDSGGGMVVVYVSGVDLRV